MSRIGIQPITVPGDVRFNLDGSTVRVSGPKGELAWDLPRSIRVDVDQDVVNIVRENEAAETRAMHGTSRSIIASMITGVHEEFAKELRIEGVGFRANLKGSQLVLQVGYSHAVEYDIPEGVTIEVPEETHVVVSGPNKQLVGQVSARIRAFCPAEPYKGKGIRYKDEEIRRKAGKMVA